MRARAPALPEISSPGRAPAFATVAGCSVLVVMLAIAAVPPTALFDFSNKDDR